MNKRTLQPTRPKHSVHLRLDLETYEALRQYAMARGMTFSYFTKKLLTQAAQNLPEDIVT